MVLAVRLRRFALWNRDRRIAGEGGREPARMDAPAAFVAPAIDVDMVTHRGRRGRRRALGVRVIEGETDFPGDLIGAQARESQMGEHVPGADRAPGPLFPRRLQLRRAPWRAPGQLHGAIRSKERGHRCGVTVVDAPDIFRTQSGQRVAFVRGYVFEVEADLVHAWRPSRLEAGRRGPVPRWLKPATVFVGLDSADIHLYTSHGTYAQYANEGFKNSEPLENQRIRTAI
jgi:hypothetical protein